MLEITRELVEHYLRATGWALTNGEWRNTSDPARYDRFPSSWIDDTGLDVDVVVSITGHSDNLPLLAFRLGLCVAAEEAEQHRIAWTTETRVPEIVRHASEMACKQFRDMHLRSAGIDPDAWESARKR